MRSLSPFRRVRGRVRVPGDKSISHRALIFSAIAKGTSRIMGLSQGADVATTRQMLSQLGVTITDDGNALVIEGLAGRPFSDTDQPLDCGNSGTTARLMMGLLAAQPREFILTGDASLSRRPMDRVIDPLREMGAAFTIENNVKQPTLPITIHGQALKAIDYTLPVASAQVKSALLLAGLFAEGETCISEKTPSRDHSERMLMQMGAQLRCESNTLHIKPSTLQAKDIDIPGDFSSAAFFLALACIHPDALVKMNNVNLNPTRTGFLTTLREMGAKVTLHEDSTPGEPRGTITAQSSNLKGVHLPVEQIPSIIDELPILAVVATQAEGETLIEGAHELRKKESDRIRVIVEGLKAMGADIEERDDGMLIKGPTPLTGASITTYGDHRVAMSFAIASCIAQGTTTIDDEACVAISYPDFFEQLDSLKQDQTSQKAST